MRAERQLGFLWGGVAALLIALSPLAPGIAAGLPGCPVRSLFDIPCPTCGTSRAALALSDFDLVGALAVNPLAALAWTVLIMGGALAGTLAAVDRPVKEPAWITSSPIRWLLATCVLVNWVYLILAGS